MAHRRSALLALALTAALVSGCGDDGGSDDGAATTAPAAADAAGSGGGADAGNPTGDGAIDGLDGTEDLADAIGGEGARDALDSVGLESKASALESAIGDDVDRIEIDGDTAHIYLVDDATFDGMMGCMVTGAVLSEGESAVFHKGGEETVCE